MYLVLLGGNIHNLLNCGLQRAMDKNVFISHLLVFISIFMFTFILNWYTPDSLVLSEPFGTTADKSAAAPRRPPFNPAQYAGRYSRLSKYLGYSILIYIFFVLSTKQEFKFMVSFLAILVALVGLYIARDIETNSLGIDVQSLDRFSVVGRAEIRQMVGRGPTDNQLTSVAAIHNLLNVGYAALPVNIAAGVFFYYLKQGGDHKNWSWLKFIFGTNSCNH